MNHKRTLGALAAALALLLWGVARDSAWRAATSFSSTPITASLPSSIAGVPATRFVVGCSDKNKGARFVLLDGEGTELKSFVFDPVGRVWGVRALNATAVYAFVTKWDTEADKLFTGLMVTWDWVRDTHSSLRTMKSCTHDVLYLPSLDVFACPVSSIDSGEVVLFNWNAVRVAESNVQAYFRRAAPAEAKRYCKSTYDCMHANSLSVDPTDGALLVNFRYAGVCKVTAAGSDLAKIRSRAHAPRELPLITLHTLWCSGWQLNVSDPWRWALSHGLHSYGHGAFSLFANSLITEPGQWLSCTSDAWAATHGRPSRCSFNLNQPCALCRLFGLAASVSSYSVAGVYRFDAGEVSLEWGFALPPQWGRPGFAFGGDAALLSGGAMLVTAGPTDYTDKPSRTVVVLAEMEGLAELDLAPGRPAQTREHAPVALTKLFEVPFTVYAAALLLTRPALVRRGVGPGPGGLALHFDVVGCYPALAPARADVVVAFPAGEKKFTVSIPPSLLAGRLVVPFTPGDNWAAARATVRVSTCTEESSFPIPERPHKPPSHELETAHSARSLLTKTSGGGWSFAKIPSKGSAGFDVQTWLGGAERWVGGVGIAVGCFLYLRKRRTAQST